MAAPAAVEATAIPEAHAASPERPSPRPDSAICSLPTLSCRPVAFCPVRTSRRFRRLATRQRRLPQHTLQYGAFPLALSSRGGGASGRWRGVPERPTASLGMPGVVVCDPAACWELESLRDKLSRVPLAPGAYGKCGLQPLIPTFCSQNVPI
jgi:hypothetical protein